MLAEADVDLIFNIAEGVEGRNREAQVPALCELLGIPYTGSDSATLAIALDKALGKKVLLQHDILTPKFQRDGVGRERLSPDMKYPLIVKPNAEGSSKGIGSTSVVDNEEELRDKVKELLERYRQPALVEEYISGREFTVGLLGDKRPRVLPPMEIKFKKTTTRAAGLRLRGQAGVGGVRLLRVPREADRGRAEGDGEDRARHVLGARLPRRRARRPAHGRRGPHLRARGQSRCPA